MLTTVLVKHEFTQIISCTTFCSLKLLSAVVNIVTVAKFDAAIISYLPVKLL